MTTAGYQFEVIIPETSVEQGIDQSLTPVAFVREAAYRKAESIANTISGEALIIAADTVAECKGQSLGKPADRDDAHRMLILMSGQLHYVHTGITVWHRPSDRQTSHVETTVLEMQMLDEPTLKRHLDSGQWNGKAGAFGYQDDLNWVHIQQGYESNVVGLPIEILPELIEKVVA